MTKPFMLIVYGAISLVIALVMYGVAFNQLSTSITSATTYGAIAFPGLQSIMGIFGMVIFITLIGAGLAMIGGGTWQTIKGGKKSKG